METQKVEEELTFQEKLLSRVHDAIFAVDENIIFTYWNEMAEKVLGWKASEIIGKSGQCIFGQIEVDPLFSEITEMISTLGFYENEMCGRRKDGTIFYGDIHVKRIHDLSGNFKGTVTTLRDITDRIAYEQNLLKKEREYLEIIDSSSDGSYIHDLEKGEMYYSAEWKNRLGIDNLTPAEAATVSSTHVHPDDRERIQAIYRKAIREKEPKVQMEFRAKTKDEDYIWILGQAKIIYNEDGKPVKYFGTHADITERKMMEEELRFQAAILESVRDPLWVSDPNLRIIYWNNAAAAAFGWTADEAMGRHTGELFRTLVPGSTREDAVARVLKKGEFFGEIVVHCKDGHSIIVEASSRAVYGPGGEVVRLVNTARDITERKRAEEEIEKADAQLAEKNQEILNERQRFFDMLETLPVMVCLITPDYHIAFANRAFREKFGESNSQHCYEYCCGLTEPCPCCESLVPFKTGQPHHREFTSPDDNIIIEAHYLPFRDTDGSPLILEMDIDVTEHRRAEEELRFQANILGIMDDAVIAFDPCQRIMYWSPGAQEMYGWTAEEARGKNPSEILRPLQYETETVQDKEERLIAFKRGELIQGENVQLRKDGSEFWVEYHSRALFDSKGILSGFITIQRDVTKRKQTEVLLQKSNEALKKSIEMKDEFLSLISHEFRTPLTVIISAIQMLKTSTWNELSDKAKGYFNTIRQNSNRQLKLVNNILDITKVNAGSYEIHKTNSDIVQLTKLIIESIGPYADRKKIIVSFSFDPAELIIGIDEEKYERILLNLLSNAIKYTPKGKSVTIKLSKRIVKNKTMACVQVCDNGIGIPADKQEHIFERFGQVDSVLSRQAEGTGIGLHLTRMFVEMLGGEIRIDSKLGTGSTFTVLIPAIKVKKTHSEAIVHEIADNRTIQLTEIEFSDIYLDKY